MAKKHHPDRGGDVNAMVQVNKAYDTLMDPARREHYDLTGEDKPITPMDVEARNSILVLFTQLFNDSARTRFNIPARAKQVVNQAKAKMSHERAEAVAFIASIAKRREEVTVSEGEDNLWLQLLESQIVEYQGKIAATDQKLAVTERVLQMLAAYRSSVQDAPATMVRGGALSEHRF